MSQTQIRKYRASVILDTRGYEKPVETLEKKLSEILAALGAKVGKVNNLGRLDFVRITDRNHVGDSHLQIEFSGEPKIPAAFHEKVRLDRTVKRLIIESRK